MRIKPLHFFLAVFELTLGLSKAPVAFAQGNDMKTPPLAIISDFSENVTNVSSSGLVLRTFSAKPGGDRTGLTYIFIETTCPICAPNVRSVDRFGNSYDIYSESTPPAAVVSVNGGYFGYNHSGGHIGLGLVIERGVLKSHRIAWDRGGFLVQSKLGGTKIVPVHSYEYRKDDLNVLQSKPLLVEAGHSGIYRDSKDRFNRTAIGITTTGKLVIAGAFEGFGRAASLYELTQFLLEMRCSDGSSINWAIAMDGGPGAQIYIPSLNRHFGDPGQNYVPNMVYIQ